MRKIICALVIGLSFTTSAMDTVTVHTAEQLIDSIQSNRLILLEPGIYDVSLAPQLSKLALDKDLKDVSVTESLLYTSGVGIVFNQVKNVTIKGLGETPDLNKLVTGNPNDYVFAFLGCVNIRLVNLEAQYDVNKGGKRKAGSWLFSQCNGVDIENNRMTRGLVGITAKRSKNITVTNSTITECSSGIVNFKDSWSVKFGNCTFQDNWACQSMWTMSRCTDVAVENCVFTENKRKDSRNCNNGKMFTISRCEMVVFSGNTIKGNHCPYLGDSETVKLITANNVMKRNKFIAMVPPKDM
jgi:parallel beta-helix repeat protein